MLIGKWWVQVHHGKWKLFDFWRPEDSIVWNRLLVIGPLLIGWWATPQTEDRK